MFRKIREKEQLLMPLFLKAGREKLCLSGSPGRTCKGEALENRHVGLPSRLQPRVPRHKCHVWDLTTLTRRLDVYSRPSIATCFQAGSAASALLC